MPFAREDRVLNFSRFDIEGVENVAPEGLDAFVFTERGVYRPGDEIHIGLIVKQRDWGGHSRDCRLRPKWSMRATRCSEESHFPRNRLRRTDLPDRQRVAHRPLHDQCLPGPRRQAFDVARLDDRAGEGVPARSHEDRVAPLKAAPAAGSPGTCAHGHPGQPLRHARDRSPHDRADRSLSGGIFSSGVSRFHLFRSAPRRQKRAAEQTVDLGEKKTDGEGQADFELQLERFADATYACASSRRL